jgi:PIN domain nuclease of toxin-antitoxin system
MEAEMLVSAVSLWRPAKKNNKRLLPLPEVRKRMPHALEVGMMEKLGQRLAGYPAKK